MWDSLSPGQWETLSVLLVGMFMGRALGAETRILTGMLIVAVVAPGSFPLMALGVIFASAIVKVGTLWISWL